MFPGTRNLMLLSVVQLFVTLEANSHRFSRIRSAPFKASHIKVDPSCHLSPVLPEPKKHRYTYKDCIMAEFGAFMSYNGELAIGKFFELKNGVVDESLSRCYNKTADYPEPKLVVNFGKCGSLGIGIDPLPGQYQGVEWRGDLVTEEIGGEGFTIKIADFKDKKCLLHPSRGAKFDAGFGADLVVTGLKYEIHRGIGGEFNDCKGQ